MLETTNKDLKIKLLKNLQFEVNEKDNSISVTLNDEANIILNQIKSLESDWNEEIFISSVVRFALEEAVKDFESES